MNERNQVIIYQTEDGQTQVDVRMENDTVWLTQAQMACLFDKDQSVIARHIQLLKLHLVNMTFQHMLKNTLKTKQNVFIKKLWA